ncbi:MAG: hypothetical protein M3Q08_00615 [Pseudomonadota bacterium]|nr:hypothetical protein [Pseudomonadota bacterium]
MRLACILKAAARAPLEALHMKVEVAPYAEREPSHHQRAEVVHGECGRGAYGPQILIEFNIHPSAEFTRPAREFRFRQEVILKRSNVAATIDLHPWR